MNRQRTPKKSAKPKWQAGFRVCACMHVHLHVHVHVHVHVQSYQLHFALSFFFFFSYPTHSYQLVHTRDHLPTAALFEIDVTPSNLFDQISKFKLLLCPKHISVVLFFFFFPLFFFPHPHYT